ncbi:MAG: ferritin-like domain-containing protein [Thermoanaerobacteraceae bacterium]|nr:ferritin-like domain-containing protein [Thermoanaerobacteraceae bacterium]
MASVRNILTRLLTYESSLIRNYQNYGTLTTNQEVKEVLLELAGEHQKNYERLQELYNKYGGG